MDLNAQGAVFILSSDEMLLKNDRCDELIASAKAQLADPVYMLFTDSDLRGGKEANLAALENELIDPGLFGGERIIKIYLKDLDACAVQVFNLLAQRLRPQVLAVIDLPRIAASYSKEPPRPLPTDPAKIKADAKASLDKRKKYAVGAIKSVGGSLEIYYRPEGRDLLDFVARRCQKYGFAIEQAAAGFLASASEGNLTVLDQALRIMQMTKSGGRITLEDADEFFRQDARFGGFEFGEAVIAGDGVRALNILNSVCNGPSALKHQYLPMQLGRLDALIKTVYEGKALNLADFSYQDKTKFFLSHGLKSRSGQDALIKACRHMPLPMLNFLNDNLSKSCMAYSRFDNDEAYAKLQEMAAAVINLGVTKFLCNA